MADLVILAADPSADIRNTRRIVDVLRRGVSVRRGGETRQP
jgi:imidazolonepropionase-like amidohydrolase